jgi:hypothetical protein
MTATRVARTLLLAAAPVAMPLAAQETRAGLIDEARGEFDADRRATWLVRAMHPAHGPPDSLWTVAAFDVAQALILSDDPDAGPLWLRLAARHAPDWPPDPSFYSPSLVLAYEREAAAVARAAALEPGVATTAWEWPDGLEPEAPGWIRFAPRDPAVQMVIRVDERSAEPGIPVPLPPGTYEAVATADGYETLRVRAEVLPGATTSLVLDPPPALPAAVRSRVEAALVTIRRTDAGQPVCVNGVLSDDGTAALAHRESLGATADLEVVARDRAVRGVAVAHVDPSHGLAVLPLPAPLTASLPAGATVTAGDPLWAVYRPGCGEPVVARTHVWSIGAGSLDLSPGLPRDAWGSPLVDRAGRLVAILTAPDRAVFGTVADDIVARATPPAPPALAAVPGDARRRGPPWVWIGAGTAAAGLAAVVLATGRGDDASAPTTGGIVISFPRGTP